MEGTAAQGHGTGLKLGAGSTAIRTGGLSLGPCHNDMHVDSRAESINIYPIEVVVILYFINTYPIEPVVIIHLSLL